MSQLVPVLKMMFGVTRHSLTFDIWGQTQLCKDKRGDKLKPTSSSGRRKIPVLPRGMLCFNTFWTRLSDPPTWGCRKVPWPILSGGRSSSKSVSSSCDGTCSDVRHIVEGFAGHVTIKKDPKENVVVLPLRDAVTVSVRSSWPSGEQEVGLCHVQPENNELKENFTAKVRWWKWMTSFLTRSNDIPLRLDFAVLKYENIGWLTVGSPLRSIPTTSPSVDSIKSSASFTVSMATSAPFLRSIATRNLVGKEATTS